jgi:succinyl-CoA synthetase beta subunit
MQNERIKVIFINIFGGMTRCNEVAKGIADAVSEIRIKKPVVVRLAGTNEEKGARILEKVGIATFTDPLEAAGRAASLAGGK